MQGHLTEQDTHWMQQALHLAEQALYCTSPNPRVACLIVRDGELLASGVTQQAGGPHAEVMALRQAAERGLEVAGSTVYVTLEPCSHHGRTPPCVDALLQAKPARVVLAMQDPNPLVAGQGIRRLQQAGIHVAGPLCVEQALAINVGFFARMLRQTPWVWLKMACSLDGRSALPNGQSQWITSAPARADGHHWRARSCVVLTGIGTVQADNPQLTVRAVQTERQPVRAIIDTHFAVSEDAAMFDGNPCWVFTCRRDEAKAERLAARQVRTILMPKFQGHVDLRAVMQCLGEQQFNEIHVEAGAKLSGALLSADCVDELLIYMAPTLLGAGRGVADLAELSHVDVAPRYEFFDVQSVGPDLRLRARKQAHWDRLLQQVQSVKRLD